MSLKDRQKWDSKYTAGDAIPREPSALFLSLDDLLPRKGRALDIAGGSGRHGLWLAQRGLDVTLADVSAVGLAVAQERADKLGVRVTTLETDLEDGPFPPGPWDLIVSICFLHRPLFASFRPALSESGMLVVIQPTKRNLERHDRPPGDFLLNEGELLTLAQGLEIVRYEEGWLVDGRHDALLVARRTRIDG